jgi:hypothetical protein
MVKYNEAINICLQIIGEQIIEGDTSIDGIYEAEQADLLIETTKEELLSEGWSFNTDYNWELTPDNDGYIVVSENMIRLDPSDTATKAFRKDSKLYNGEDKSYIWDAAVECDIVWNLDFDDCPPIFQQYVTLKAGRILYQRLVGDTGMLDVLLKDEQEALLRVRLHEDDVNDLNIFDDQTVSRAITRTSNPRGLRG